MSEIIYAILLALSLSLDSLGIGASYGIKNIKIPFGSKLIISIITFMLSALSVSIGGILSIYLPDIAIRIISFIMLSALAISMFIPNKKSNNSKNSKNVSECKKIFSLFIKWAGLTITIIREPIKGDADNSEVIEFKEAIYIGAALSLDALCACMGFCEDSMGIFLPILISVFQFTFMCIGERLGNRIMRHSDIYERFAAYIPSIILILIAITRIIP